MEPATIGFSIVGVLQLANIAYTRQINSKLDQKIDKVDHDKDIENIKALCDERRGTCSGQVQKDREFDRHEMHAIERKIGRHTHSNGDGVKFLPEGG